MIPSLQSRCGIRPSVRLPSAIALFATLGNANRLDARQVGLGSAWNRTNNAPTGRLCPPRNGPQAKRFSAERRDLEQGNYSAPTGEFLILVSERAACQADLENVGVELSDLGPAAAEHFLSEQTWMACASEDGVTVVVDHHAVFAQSINMGTGKRRGC